MKRRVLCAFLFTMSVLAFGQPRGNEWINYDRQYWRFDLVQEGVFRIDSATLANAGFPVSSVDPRDIQVFGREKEVAIYIDGEGDGVFNTADFIEFYAEKNDGWKDVTLWDDPAHINNPYYSLINDTIRYYITWDASAVKKRAVANTNAGYLNYPGESWFWTESIALLNTKYQKGTRSDVDGQDARIGFGEGYFYSFEINSNGLNADFQNQTLATPLPYQGGGTPNARCRVVTGAQNNAESTTENHHTRILYGAGFQVEDTIYKGFSTCTFDFEISGYEVNGAGTQFTLMVPHNLSGPGQAGEFDPNYSDRQSFAYLMARYAHQVNMGPVSQMHAWMPDNANDDPHHLGFIGFIGVPLMYALNGDTVYRQLATNDGSYWQLLAPADGASNETHIFINALANVIPVTALTKVNNGTGYFTDFSQLQADSAMLIVTHQKLMNAAIQYQNHRENVSVNHYDVILADVDELYDQFGGGIELHPLAIRNWCGYLLDTLPTKPRGLFLLGKSVQAAKISSSVLGHRGSVNVSSKCLVPTMGYPPSDPLLTIGLLGDPSRMEIPVGRLSATNETEAVAYLNKVQSFEGFQAQPPQPWMKNILHFRGGFTESEFYQFGQALQAFEELAEDTSFGGNVTDFAKLGSGLIQQASADSVRHLIEDEGTTLLTFFAHASGGGFDITIDDVNSYDWNGKYPMTIGNSCYAGNIHLVDQFSLQGTSASERATLPAEHGMIAFLSSVDIGLSGYLQQYTTEFYRSFSQLNYGGSIGDHMQAAVDTMLSHDAADINQLNTGQTFTLEGDPTLVLNSYPQPEFEIRDIDISTVPDVVTAEDDSFQVRAAVMNTGRATDAPVRVSLIRTLPDGAELQPIHQELYFHFRDTAVFTLPVLADSGGQGVNSITVKIDLDPDLIDEDPDDIFNNEARADVNIISGDLLPIWPHPFAITGDPGPLLKASTGDPFAAPHGYVFQIDTTDLFNSPVMESGMVNAPGGVVSWQPQFIYGLNAQIDSLVYFWRTSVDSTGNNGEYNWYERSFQHIANRTGFGQAHYFQYKEDGYSQVDYDRPERDFDFFEGDRNIRCRIIGQSTTVSDWWIDLSWQEGLGCQGTLSWHVAVVDPADFSAWATNFNGANPDHSFGNSNEGPPCRSRPEKFFIFRTAGVDAIGDLDGLADMLNNRIPDGHYVLIYTWKGLDKDGTIANGGQDVLDWMNANGATSLDTIPEDRPYIFFTRKGYPGTQQEVWGDSTTADIQMSAWVQSNGNSGNITWPMIGPASEWDALYWNENPVNAQDSTRIKLYGVTAGGAEQFLYDMPSPNDSLTAFTDTVFNVEAQDFPYLKLVSSLHDYGIADPVPAQMDRWQLLGTPAPECAIDPPSGLYDALDSVYGGQPGRYAVAVRNVSEYGMDSLLLTAWVTDRNGNQERIHYKRNAPLPVGGILMDTVVIDNTLAFRGINRLKIEANPIDTITGVYDQVEMHHFNNIAELRFDVQADDENPVLDITFDGMHIIDQDVVSAKPEITITLDDDNETLIFDDIADSSRVQVFLTAPDGTTQQLRYFVNGQENLQWIDASAPDNILNIIYRPTFSQDGTYTLQVRAKDLSDNISGQHDYKVSFQVINRPTITEVLNYPNPFTTSTRFVFTLTGTQTPTGMMIQIMTISGRVVRTVHLDELGPIRIGRNITEFAWDGTDEFGDKLARGVYLYRVVAQLNGEDIEYRETSAGGFFEKGFGKMYLLR